MVTLNRKVKFKITWSLKDESVKVDHVIRTVTESFTLEQIEAGEHLDYLYTINDMEMDNFGVITSRRQYIGVNDVNNVEIYEGDIVRWDDGSNGEKWRVAIVELIPALQFKIIRINCDFIQSAKEGHVFKFGSFIYTDTHNHLEIIGNVFESDNFFTQS